MSTPHSSAPPAIPGTFVNLLVDAVARWNITPAQLLESSSISIERLQEMFWYVDFHEYNQLLARAIALTDEPGLGVHMGMQMSVTCLGVIGFAAIVAKNVREALEVSGQFLAMRCPAIGLHLEQSQDMAHVYINQPLPDYQLNEAGITCLLVGIGQMGCVLTGQKLTGIAEVTFCQPSYFERLSHLVASGIYFDRPYNRLTFPASVLDKPLIMADPQAARLAREHCKRALSAVSGNHSSFASLVRELVYDEAFGFCTMEDVALKLHISQRTLQRQLASESLCFSDIVKRLREEKAEQLLRQNKLSIAAIAERLGYIDPSNFNRAFKRWQGKTASKYRNEMAKQPNIVHQNQAAV